MKKKSKIEVKYAGKSQKQLRKMRRDAAESVCWQLLFAMGMSDLSIPAEERKWFVPEMQKWADLGAMTGLLQDA